MKITVLFQGQSDKQPLEIQLPQEASLQNLISSIEEKTQLKCEQFRLVHKGKLMNLQQVNGKLKDDLKFSDTEQVYLLQNIRPSRAETPSQAPSSGQQSQNQPDNVGQRNPMQDVANMLGATMNVVMSDDQGHTQVYSGQIPEGEHPPFGQFLNQMMSSFMGQGQGQRQRAPSQRQQQQQSEQLQQVQQPQQAPAPQPQTAQQNLPLTHHQQQPQQEQKKQEQKEVKQEKKIEKQQQQQQQQANEEPKQNNEEKPQKVEEEPSETSSSDQQTKQPELQQQKTMTQLTAEYEEGLLKSKKLTKLQNQMQVYKYNMQKVRKIEDDITQKVMKGRGVERQLIKNFDVQQQLMQMMREDIESKKNFIQQVEELAGVQMSLLSKEDQARLLRNWEEKLKGQQK